ncbi:hypothetical protein [Zavarzinella formosa]|uniref:hypothetical protein n=1 Tax=Zavarzinella formosa TaxID=360055 RepID=UPI0002EE05C8|nr:hypothetical protein [Zavarzinella formosa]
MPKFVTIEEYHVTIRVPAGRPDEAADTMQSLLGSRPFMARLRAAVAAVLADHALLAAVRVTVTR